MMTLKEFAKMLNGREYGGEISISEEQLAKELGFVVVFGYSDDCIELRGAVDEEIGLRGSGEIGNNLLPKPIFADNCPEDYDCQWAFGTALPHESFDIYEGEELYCVGIVCDINAKPNPMTNGDYIRSLNDESLAVALNAMTKGMLAGLDMPYAAEQDYTDIFLRFIKRPAEAG